MRVGDRNFARACTAPQRHPTFVDEYPAHPGIEAVEVAQKRDATPCTDKRLLRGVARVGLIAENRHGRSKKRLTLRQHDLFERLPISGMCPNQELAIHQLPRCDTRFLLN